jgi:hypothetical protein
LSPAGDGRLDTLLTSTTSYVDAPLAKFYGVAGAPGPDGKVTLPAGRSGILTQASFLAVNAKPDEENPFRRGKAVWGSLLCTEFEPPTNPSEPIMLPERDPTQTSREHFAAASDRPCAAACHTLINPVGFAFENFDGIGAYRTTDVGKPVDASGSITLGGVSRSFQNAVEFSQLLATSDEVRTCVPKQWMRYLLRRLETDGEATSLATVGNSFRGSAYDVRALMLAVVGTRAFTHRTPSVGEP